MATCNLCGSDACISLFKAKDLRFYTGQEFTLVKCTKCELVYLDPIPAEEEISTYYPPAYFGEKESLADRQSLRSSDYETDKLSQMHRSGILSQKGRILDIGCGNGAFLANMKQRNWEVYGIETAKIAADYAQEEIGTSVINKKIQDAGFASQYFDVITLWHVLEHLPDPSAALAEVHRILKPQGQLLISLPNFQSLQAQLMKSDWYHLDVPRHIYHFTPKTISELLAKTGLAIIKISFVSPAYNRDGIAFSVIRRYERWRSRNIDPGNERNSSTGKARSPLQAAASRFHSSDLLRLLVKRALDGCISLSSLLESYLGYGGTMHVLTIKS
jgi:SAM-dependent methyltransferase